MEKNIIQLQQCPKLHFWTTLCSWYPTSNYPCTWWSMFLLSSILPLVSISSWLWACDPHFNISFPLHLRRLAPHLITVALFSVIPTTQINVQRSYTPESNLNNSHFDTPPNQLNRFVCGKSTFDKLKVTLLTALKAQSEDLTPPITSISHTQIFSSTLLLSNITPTPSMILAIKSATPAQVAQVLKTILTFPKAKVSVVGPIDHVPEHVEAAAKTTNGNWSLHIL